LNLVNYGARLKSKKQDFLKVLILADYLPVETHAMLEMLIRALSHISKSMEFIIKPHPNCPVNIDQYPELNLRAENRSLKEISCDFDIAFSGNSTTASLDAFLIGLPLIIRLDESELNYSPLRGNPDILFVTQDDDLAVALNTLESISEKENESCKYFYLNKELDLWRNLLLKD